MIEQTLEQILHRQQSGKRLIVGVDGLSGAGKTTWVEALLRELRAQSIPYQVFHIDDHIVERAKRYQTGHEEWYEHYGLQWDVTSLTQTLFENLRHEVLEFELGYYDASADQVTRRRVTVPLEGVVLVEGTFLQRSEWRGYYDYLLYIDCPRDTRFARVTRRGGKNPHDLERIAVYERRYWAAEDYYLEHEQPSKRADAVWSTE